MGGKYGIPGVINPKESVRSSNKIVGWHKSDHITYWPTKEMTNNDLDAILDELFSAYAPAEPLFSKDDQILTMGSCFALRIREWLKTKGRGTESLFIPAGLNNTFAIRQFIEWVMTGNRSHDAYWYDELKDGVGKWEAPEDQKTIKKAFQNHAGYIITLGLSEVWRDKETNGVFWRGVPNNVFDEEKHESVVSTVPENVNNIKTIIKLLRENCGDKPIIITLSPVPLNATFQDRPCIVSDCLSKSILRVAIDQALTEVDDKNVYYWPSFEYVKWLPAHMSLTTFGGVNRKGKPQNSRHVDTDVVGNIISYFSDKFFKE